MLFGCSNLREFVIKHPFINFVFIFYLYYSLRNVLNCNLFYIDIDINQIYVLFIYYLEYYNHIYLHKYMYIFDDYRFNNINYDVSNKNRIKVFDVFYAVNESDSESSSDKEVSDNKSKNNNGSSGNQRSDDSDSMKSEESDDYDEVEALLERHVDTLKD